jgi:hypothetical protein
VVDCEANRRIVFFDFLALMGEGENCSYLEGSLLSHGSYAYFEVLCCWQTGVCWLLHSRETCAYAS